MQIPIAVNKKSIMQTINKIPQRGKAYDLIIAASDLQLKVL